MQRMYNVDKWTTIEEGQSLAFLNSRARNVRLEVNTPSAVELWYECQATGEAFFLALVKGRDVVEFGTVGPFAITTKGGFVNVFTNDGDDVSMQPTAERAFVKIMERRARNPELEAIAAVMQQNMQRNLEAQAHELERLFERRIAAAEQARLEAERASAAGNAGAESAPTGTTGTVATGGTTDGGSTNNEAENSTGPGA